MTQSLKQTVRLQRPGKVSLDDRGRTVWSGPVEETEFELVSTVMLKQMLDSKNEDQKKKLAEAAAGRNGVLAQNLQSGTFEIIDDDDLKSALASADDTPVNTRAADVTCEPVLEHAATGDEELSLVSTQMLRKMLGHEGEVDGEKPGAEPEMPGGGFDPYNSA